MIITIDTQKDSPEEIKKAIRLLSALTDGQEYELNSQRLRGNSQTRNIFEDSSSTIQPQQNSGSGGLFGFIDNADQQVQLEQTKQEKEPQASEDELIEYY